MPKVNLYLPAILFATFVTFIFCTATVIAGSAHEIAISESIKKQWSKPHQPVDVPVIAISGDFAVADWIQGQRGGRALLRQVDHDWQTLLCGDIQIKSVQELKKAGVPEVDAIKIVETLDEKEAKLDKYQLAVINTFQGIVDLLATPQHHHH